MCKKAETRLMCNAGQWEGSCNKLTIRPCKRSYKETVGLPQLLPGEVKFFLNRTRSLCLYLKVVLIRHQDFQHKVLYMINFFEFPLFRRKVPTSSFFQEKPETKEERIQTRIQNKITASCYYHRTKWKYKLKLLLEYCHKTSQYNRDQNLVA